MSSPDYAMVMRRGKGSRIWSRYGKRPSRWFITVLSYLVSEFLAVSCGCLHQRFDRAGVGRGASQVEVVHPLEIQPELRGHP